MPTSISIADMSLSQIEERYGVKAKMGRLVRARNKLQFKADGKTWDLSETALIASKPIGKIVGAGLVAGGIIIDGRVVVVTIPRPPRFIICYKPPPPDLIRRINYASRKIIIEHLVAEKLLPKNLAKDLQVDIAPVR